MKPFRHTSLLFPSIAPGSMLKNYLKIAVRTLRKHPAYAVINVAGLAVGMACFMLIMLCLGEHLFRITGEAGISSRASHAFSALQSGDARAKNA